MTIIAKFFLLIVVTGGCIGTAFGKAANEKTIAHYSFNLPSGYVLRDISPERTDFNLYEIYRKTNSKVNIRLYFGSAPWFPTYKWDTLPVEEVNGICTKKTFAYREGDGSMEGVLIFTGLSYFGRDQSPYTQIYYYATGVDRRTAESFVRMISSIKVVKPNYWGHKEK
jgi:hypothetical protein